MATDPLLDLRSNDDGPTVASQIEFDVMRVGATLVEKPDVVGASEQAGSS